MMDPIHDRELADSIAADMRAERREDDRHRNLAERENAKKNRESDSNG
jgi:hypothetical protein